MLDPALALDQDVGRLHVAVHEAALVRRVERGRDLPDQHKGANRLEPRLGRDDPCEVVAVDEPHRHVEPTVLLPGVVDRDHVRVLDRGGGLELKPKAGPELFVLGDLGRDHLQRHLALERDMQRAVYDTHPAPARHTANHVVSERGADRELSHRWLVYQNTCSLSHPFAKKARNSGTIAHISGWISRIRPIPIITAT